MMSTRIKTTRPFYVLQLFERAQRLEAQGRSVIHLEIGEPDFATPPAVVNAYLAALHAGQTRYSPAVGIDALRDKLCDYYWQQFQVKLNRQQIIITAGASGALLTFLTALVHADGEVLMTDPGYPCNSSMVSWLGGRAVNIPVGPEEHYQLTPEHIQQYWTPKTLGALVASPSNPTGAILDAHMHQQLLNAVKQQGGWLITDEIYQGFTYDAPARSVLQLDNQALVVNSFSKFFAMSGLRLGWLVAPESLHDSLRNITQNISIAPNTPSQYAALAAFDEDCLQLYELRRLELQQRRNLLLDALPQLGFAIGVIPQGAFYIYARLPEDLPLNSTEFCDQLLEKTGVAMTPGIDFGIHQANRHVRIAYTVPDAKLREAMARLADFIEDCRRDAG
jgi:aspartate/methionine/tyrosine aminotransferase